jgi:GNAT superfamily N-acetyltransferase
VVTVPSSYLASITSRWPQDWDAMVALRDGEIVGWAEFGRNGGREDADVAVCVIDSEQGHGLGTALLQALLPEASGLGLTSIHADISATNTAALRTWLRATQGLHATLDLVEGALRATAVVEAAAPRAA